jgi:hypothetical protein
MDESGLDGQPGAGGPGREVAGFKSIREHRDVCT